MGKVLDWTEVGGYEALGRGLCGHWGAKNRDRAEPGRWVASLRGRSYRQW